MRSRLTLIFVSAVLREAMRLQPTAAIRVVNSVEDTTISNGKYFVPKGAAIALLTWDAHRDVKVWGADVSGSQTQAVILLILCRLKNFVLKGC
jgi:hypothetical protein